MIDNEQKVYVFPPSNGGKNPYITCFESSISKVFLCPPRNKVYDGVLDLLYNFNSKAWIINWDTNLAFRKFGFLQVFLYVILLVLRRLCKKKNIWILHNKGAHQKNNFLSNLTAYCTAKFCTITCTHSQEGVVYYKDKFKRNNVYYYPHPAYPNLSYKITKSYEYDYIIWGSILRYKNIAEFLRFAVKDEQLKTKKILICGRCSDVEYNNEIQSIIQHIPDFEYVNKFLSEEEIISNIEKSKNILFTYASKSVLSSGALIFSLPAKKLIIGPAVGAFKDLNEMGVIANYYSFDEIAGLDDSFDLDESKIQEYLNNYTWDNFALFIKKLLLENK